MLYGFSVGAEHKVDDAGDRIVAGGPVNRPITL